VRIKSYTKKFVTIAVCLILAAGCGEDPVSFDENTDVYIHEGTGIPLAYQEGVFTRVRVVEGDMTRVEYYLNQAKSEATMSVLIYPNPDVPAEGVELDDAQTTAISVKQLKAIEDEIAASGTDEEHRFIASYDLFIERAGKPVAGKRAYFRDRFDAFTNAYLFEYGDWYVEYRTVFARDLERLAEKFVLEHSWGKAAESKKK
jgi:hypothetical protein